MDTHSWNVSPREAVELQRHMRHQVTLTSLAHEPERIGGCDVSMNRFAAHGFAGFVTLSYPGLNLLETSTVEDVIPFPYVPGLLSFREIPMLLKAWEKLSIKPDVLMVDGIGIAHPRRFGIASHLGVILGIPTIGCAKSVLTGIYEEPDQEPGSVSYLRDRHNSEEILGAVVRTKRNVKPMFISPGHLITLEDSIRLVIGTVHKHRLPEPTRRAHMAVNEARVHRFTSR